MNTLTSFPFSSALAGLLVCSLGAGAFAKTDLKADGRSLVGGQYQRAVEDRFDDALPLRGTAIKAWNAINLAVFGQANTEVIIAQDDWLFTAEEFRAPAAQDDFEAELDTALAALNARGIQLVPLIVPDKARVYSDKLAHGRATPLETRHARVQEMLAARGLPNANLLTYLDQGRQRADTFMRTDTHWSPRGAEIAARAVAVAINDHTVAPSPFETRAFPIEDFVGDLMPFIDAGAFASWVGQDIEQIERFETVSLGGAGGLFGEVSIPVALVGTSFSARDDFNFAGFLQQHTGLDLVNYATEGQGPFAPMRDFLASDALETSPPTIVVWEIPERYITLKELP